MTLPVWQATHAYVAGTRVTPVSPDGTVWQVSTAGTSAGGQPTWPTAEPWTVTDGTAAWMKASGFRMNCVSGVASVLRTFRAANPSLLVGVSTARPRSGSNFSLPGAYIGTRRETVIHGNSIRQTELSIPVVVILPVPDNGQAEDQMDITMDGLRDAFTLNYHAASNFAITAESAAEETDEIEVTVPYLANILTIVNQIAEGRQ